MPLLAFMNVSRWITQWLAGCSAGQKTVCNFKWLILIRQLERLQQQSLGALNHICHKICLVVLAAPRFSPAPQHSIPLVGSQW